MKYYILFILLFINSVNGFSQLTVEEVTEKLEELSSVQIGLTEKVEVNISGVSLSSFITTIASEHNLNVSVDSDLKNVIVSNFYDALVKNVFVFLIRKYNLTVEFTGTIIAFKSTPLPPKQKVVLKPKVIDVSYKEVNTFLSMNLKHDSLAKVVEAITRVSGNNVILSPDVKEKLVSVYIENRPFPNAIEMMAKSNGLLVEKDIDDVYYLSKNSVPSAKNNSQKNNRYNKQGNSNSTDFKLELNGNGKIDIEAREVPIKDIINQASELTGEHFFMYNIPEGKASLSVKNMSYEVLLTNILKGTEFTFKKEDNYFVIGNRNTEGLRTFELIQLVNRSIETVKDLIPTGLLKGLESKEYIELNGFMVSGSYVQIQELKSFLRAIDVVVPMVQIDIIIVRTSKSNTLEVGLKAGLKDKPTTTSGQVNPGIELDLGAQTINGLIKAFNGFGLLNLGLVKPNFYASLTALERNGFLDKTSTPKISTLNGHEANLVIGTTDYYEQSQTSITNTTTGSNVAESRVYIPTEANLSITVKPFVSADEYVTLEVRVEQSDFVERLAPEAPPGKTSESFESLIRVKNGEMILIGGLERKEKNESGEGAPLLSRIPVIKWFFSGRTKIKEKSKLHIFINPTVTY